MKKKILIVDDDWTILELLKLTFSSAGYKVCVAQNDLQFRQVAFSEPPDVIILDIMLGEKNGVHVYDELIREGLDSHIPVVFLSILANDRQQIPPQRGRMYALVPKPFDPEKLVEEIACFAGD
jgi:DNA-binding response OmpR family regulator